MQTVQTRTSGFLVARCPSLDLHVLYMCLVPNIYVSCRMALSFPCPWSSIDPTLPQGEWWCNFCLEMKMWDKSKVIKHFMYTEREGVGWWMCGLCQGIWQHTQDQLEDDVESPCVIGVCHMCKYIVYKYPHVSLHVPLHVPLPTCPTNPDVRLLDLEIVRVCRPGLLMLCCFCFACLVSAMLFVLQF